MSTLLFVRNLLNKKHVSFTVVLIGVASLFSLPLAYTCLPNSLMINVIYTPLALICIANCVNECVNFYIKLKTLFLT
jgi:hypothetical protein